ncbi:MAG: hypothetical protein ABH950_01620 [Candidatus Altiarchaeota archaeon]
MKQSVYLIVGGAIIFYVYTGGGDIPVPLRTLFVVVVALAVMGVMMFDLDKKLLNLGKSNEERR